MEAVLEHTLIKCLFPASLQVRAQGGRKEGELWQYQSRLAPCPDVQLGSAIRRNIGNSFSHLQSSFPYRTAGTSSLPAQPLAGE